MDSVKAQISSEVDALTQEMYAISDFLKANPETAYQEYKACDHMSRVLEEKGFRVQKGGGGKARLAAAAKPCSLLRKCWP